LNIIIVVTFFFVFFDTLKKKKEILGEKKVFNHFFFHYLFFFKKKLLRPILKESRTEEKKMTSPSDHDETESEWPIIVSLLPFQERGVQDMIRIENATPEMKKIYSGGKEVGTDTKYNNTGGILKYAPGSGKSIICLTVIARQFNNPG
jgi:SNF2 family DNA or RNA helicase